VIPSYHRVGTGRIYEVGAAWIWPVAMNARKMLASIGVFVGIDLVAGWIAGAFASGAQATASGDEISAATRDYYLGVLEQWHWAAEGSVDAARMTFLLPVINRAKEIMTDPGATHADLVAAVRGVSTIVEEQALISGTPIEESEPEAVDEGGLEVIEGEMIVEFAPGELPPGSVAIPSPGEAASLRAAAMAAGPPGWILLAAVAGLAGWAWWTYGR
jgi:hypothetical protein